MPHRLLLLPLIVACLVAQEPDPLAGYRMPTFLRVAPGQVLTLHLAGFALGVNEPQLAPGSDLTAPLAGVQVSLRTTKTLAVPILGIAPTNTCGAVFVVGGCKGQRLLAITIQIPFELDTGEGSGVISVSEGTNIAEYRVRIVPDQAHVIRACDAQAILNGTYRPDCRSAITHSNGKPVSEEDPAHAGETLVAYLYGLGRPDAPVQTGTPTPAIAPRVSSLYSFSMLIRAAVPRWFDAQPGAISSEVQFVGMTPGSVGLYQINFTVPTLTEESVACVAAGDFTNATIIFQFPNSSAEAKFCIAK
ncbi:hypothetical protein [Bryobacter aggregatus]|uniref:hypothetical protein n=1 Tax=Bryobacter aggregatus TaxID=360054 RepID=UPI0004E13896|nr:hypothetical protein [Bryobacter aggregatus]